MARLGQTWSLLDPQQERDVRELVRHTAGLRDEADPNFQLSLNFAWSNFRRMHITPSCPFCLSDSPSNCSYVETPREKEVEKKDDFDWGKYLMEGEEIDLSPNADTPYLAQCLADYAYILIFLNERKICEVYETFSNPTPDFASEESEENMVELADGFSYVTKPYVGEVHQARKTVQCQSEILDDDILEVLVHEANFTIYKIKVQVHQADSTIKQWSQSLHEDIMEEMVNGYNYCTLLNKRKVHQATDTRTCCTEIGAEVNFQFREACKIGSLQGGKLKSLEEFMIPDLLSGNFTHLSTFRTRHLAFSRAEILDDLIPLSCPLIITSETIKIFSTLEGLPAYSDNGHSPRDHMKRAIASTVGISRDQVQVLGQPLHFLVFWLKLPLVQVYFPTSQKLCQTHLIRVILEILDITAASLKELRLQIKSNAQPHGGPTDRLVPLPARGLVLPLPGLKLYLKPR